MLFSGRNDRVEILPGSEALDLLGDVRDRTDRLVSGRLQSLVGTGAITPPRSVPGR